MNFIKILLISALLSIINLTYSQGTPVSTQYNNEKLSVAENGVKSLFIPGWGNSERASTYQCIEIIGIIGTAVSFFYLLDNPVEGEGLLYLGVFYLSTGTLGANHLISSLDAMITTTKYNEELKKKYNLSFSPTYNPKNNGVGIGFSVNF